MYGSNIGQLLVKYPLNVFFHEQVALLPWVRMHYQPSYSLDQTVDIFERDTNKEVSDIYI